MLRYIEKENKKLGFKYKNYYLPQGDSFSLTATEKGGEEGVDLISRIVFKLGLNETECKINPIFEQDYRKDTEGVWTLIVRGKDTAEWKPTCACDDEPYVYEIEAYFIDGEPVTLTSGAFTIEPQIGGSL